MSHLDPGSSPEFSEERKFAERNDHPVIVALVYRGCFFYCFCLFFLIKMPSNHKECCDERASVQPKMRLELLKAFFFYRRHQCRVCNKIHGLKATNRSGVGGADCIVLYFGNFYKRVNTNWEGFTKLSREREIG